ncbi:MAG: porphobilinogen synthase, partial [Gaiellaceae bacterium]|nr:porphobilinogen synthase [Gaiellaceae bacterium]
MFPPWAPFFVCSRQAGSLLRRASSAPRRWCAYGLATAGQGLARGLTPALRTGAKYSLRMSSFPDVRLRRFRRTGALRGLVRETRLDLEAFVMPYFVAPEPLRNEALPGMSRHSVDGIVREVEELVRGGVQAVMLFGIPEDKDEQATGAWEDDGIVQQALRALRPRFPEL